MPIKITFLKILSIPVLIIVILLELIVAIIILFDVIVFLFRGSVFVPSKKEKDLIRIIEILKSKNAGNKMIDLGSGDGRIVRLFASHGFESYGVELNFLLYLWSKIKNRNFPQAHFRWGNFYNVNLKDFDIIYCFQGTKINRKILDKVEKESKPGTFVISYIFPLNSTQNIKLIDKIGKFYLAQKY